MKLAEKTVEVTSNIQFDETHKVTIDESAVSMVIERLISAYKNPYRAALREYTSNAYDEHLVAGVNRPVEVTLPDALSPVLKVQDFGRGLNREELKGFGTIGLSTKRDSNETTGGFGMGSKCALAAAAQFTVVSVKDGKRNTVIVARDEHNVPQMNFLAEAETDDPSGTTVIVPISDRSKFGDLTDFFVAWPTGSVLVDDEEPKRSIHDPAAFQSIKNGIAYNDRSNIQSGRDAVRVVINQVYYVLDYKSLGLTFKQWEMLRYYIVRLDNGSVDIAPSREDLLYNARTKAAVEARFEEILSVAAEAKRVEAENAQTIQDALSKLRNMRALGLPTTGIVWKGIPLTLPGEIVNGTPAANPEGTWANPYRDSKTRTGWRVEKSFATLQKKPLENFSSTYRLLIVHGAGPETTYGTYNNLRAHREAFGVGEYLAEIDASGAWDVFITSDPETVFSPLVKELASSIISAEDFNKVVTSYRAKNKTGASGSKRKDKSEDRPLKVVSQIWGHGSHAVDEVTAQQIKDAGYKHVVYLRNQIGGVEERIRNGITTKGGFESDLAQCVRSAMAQDNVAIVLLGKNESIHDLDHILPEITTFPELFAAHIRRSVKTLNRWERVAARDRDRSSVTSLITAVGSEIDPLIKNADTRKWIKALRDYKDPSQVIRMFNWISEEPTVKAALKAIKRDDSGKDLPESPLRRYPLLQSMSTYNRPNAVHLAEYINAMDKIKAKAKA